MVALAEPGAAGTIFSYTAWGNPNVGLAPSAEAEADASDRSTRSDAAFFTTASSAGLLDKSCCNPLGSARDKNPPCVPSTFSAEPLESVDASPLDDAGAARMVAASLSASDATTLLGLKPSASSSTSTASG